MAGQGLKSCWKNEMDQADITEAAKEQYKQSVQQNAPSDVQQNLRDTMVWEETKSFALGCATTEAANKAIAEQNSKKSS